MSHNFQQDARPKAIFPVGNMGLIPVPPELSMKDYLESRDVVYLYNPFGHGLATKAVPLAGLTYRELSQAFIVDKPDFRELNSKGKENLEKYQHLSNTAKIFWGVFVSVTRRILTTPKREQDRKMDITPDMGLVLQKPKRKIEGPQLVRRPGPPKPGGR